MLYHYAISALRHFRTYKFTTSINVVCLAVGLLCFLGIHGVITYLGKSDQHSAKADRTYVITQNYRQDASAPAATSTLPQTGWPVGKYLREDFPELEIVARATAGLGEEVPISVGPNNSFVHAAFADPQFLEVFDLSFIVGSRRTALREPHSAVVTQGAAIRLFGDARRALGQRVRLEGEEVSITGVIADVEQPSHMGHVYGYQLRFDLLASMDVYEAGAQNNSLRKSLIEGWESPLTFTYVVLPANGSLTAIQLERRLALFGARHAPKRLGVFEYSAIRIGAIRLALADVLVQSNVTGVSSATLLQIIGLLVLLISCVNYANLATAQATTRAKEIGMRRVVGASRLQVMTQYLFEAALTASVSIVIALLMLALAGRQLPGAGFVFDRVAGSVSSWIGLLSLLIVVSLTAGAYPALVLSRVKPASAVRAGQMKMGARFVPSLLVGAQFFTVSFLLIAILVMGKQSNEFREAALAGMKDPVIVISNDLNAAGVSFALLRSQLMRQAHVGSVSGSMTPPWYLVCNQANYSRSAQKFTATTKSCYYTVNFEFHETLGFRLLAGRLFDRSRAEESTKSKTVNVVIDDTMARQHGWARPQDAVNKTIYRTATDITGSRQPVTVIGVVETRPLGMLSFGARSSIFFANPSQTSYPLIRLKGNVAAGVSEIDAVWKELAPTVALKREFADDLFDRQYRTFNIVARVFSGVAVLAAIISVLGLIGMSVHVIGCRTQEIGIRKTLGASAGNIVMLLLVNFSKPVVVANLLAWPLAYLAMQVYLSMFAGSASSMSVGPFLLSLLATLVVAWTAVFAQASSAARLRPATVLRFD